MRGNLVLRSEVVECFRSIPASAGQPLAASFSQPTVKVYPRECGATEISHYILQVSPGLSPRVRGNLNYRRRRRYPWGSIPASAGQPSRQGLLPEPESVYPRECGATEARWAFVLTDSGLSPRVRGNPRPGQRRRARPGSIPASAGQPWTWPWASRWWTVYPRECGATGRVLLVAEPAPGLSPRVRGNPPAARWPRAAGGSIPASAGQPEVAGSPPR